MAEVLIAHDSENIDFAELVQMHLRNDGHNAGLDSAFPDAGDAWQEKLDQAICNADIIVVIMTPEARASSRVTYVWAFALGAGLGVIPLELKSTPFHPRLDVLKRLDFTERQRPWEAFLVEIEKTARSTTIPVSSDAPLALKNAVAALDSLKVEDQVAGVQSLAKMDHQEARKALAHALEHPVRTVRIAAAFKFPDRTDPRIITGLIDAYRNEDFLQQWSQTLELDFREPPYKAMIARIGPPAAPYLLEVLQDPKHKIRAFAACELGRIGETRAVEPLISLLTDKSMPARWEAARALGRIGDKAAAAHLVEALGDENDGVRAAAARALGQMGHNASAELLHMLENDTAQVREAIAEALGELGVRSAVPDLLEHLCKDRSNVRAAVALALGRIGDPVALTPLVEAFQSSAERTLVRRAAAQALGLYGDPSAADALSEYLTHRRSQNRWQGNELDFEVAEALIKLGCTESFDLVGKALGSYRSGLAPIRVVELLGSFGGDAVPALIDLLDNRSLQKTSAKILKKIGTVQAIAAVKQWSRSH